MSMYGTRDAAQNSEASYTATLVENAFVQGKSTPCAFRHSTRDLSLVVHGDDFTALGDDDDLDWLVEVLQEQ